MIPFCNFRDFLSDSSRQKIESLLPLVKSMYPKLQIEQTIIPTTANESVSFIGKDNGTIVLQYSFWGNHNGDIQSITIYSNDVTLTSLYRKFSNSNYILGFKIKNIELDTNERPYFIDIDVEEIPRQ